MCNLVLAPIEGVREKAHMLAPLVVHVVQDITHVYDGQKEQDKVTANPRAPPELQEPDEPCHGHQENCKIEQESTCKQKYIDINENRYNSPPFNIALILRFWIYKF